MSVRDREETDLWAELCDRFHDIRQRAYAHGLENRWRRLAGTGAGTLGPLADWLALVAEIDRLDEGRTDWAVRFGEDDAAGGRADDDWWDGWGSAGGRFSCPKHVCARAVSQGLMTPRCWLYDCDMDAAGDGG